MNKAYLKQLNKKIDKIISNKALPTFPIMAGLSINFEQSRPVTAEESEILYKKGLPCPILIALSGEQEFSKYLNYERTS